MPPCPSCPRPAKQAALDKQPRDSFQKRIAKGKFVDQGIERAVEQRKKKEKKRKERTTRAKRRAAVKPNDTYG